MKKKLFKGYVENGDCIFKTVELAEDEAAFRANLANMYGLPVIKIEEIPEASGINVADVISALEAGGFTEEKICTVIHKLAAQ